MLAYAFQHKRSKCYTEWSCSFLITCENISKEVFGWKAGCNITGYDSDNVPGPTDDHSQLHAQPYRRACNGNWFGCLMKMKMPQTYAKEKLSTFCISATALPSIVIFVNGVLCSVSLPYHFMARTVAWPPSQLQIISASPACIVETISAKSSNSVKGTHPNQCFEFRIHQCRKLWK